MHYAKLENSDRLKRVADLLTRSRKPLTTRDIIRKAHVCAINSIVSELRAQGIRIDCWRKKNRFYYQLEAYRS